MKTAHWIRFWIGTSLSLALAAVLTLPAQDWPQWRGPNRDGKASDFHAPATWPKNLTRQWEVTVGRGDATPALVGNRLYVFARQEGREVILCLDAASGKEIWRDSYDSLDATGPAGRHSGPRSSPAVAQGKVLTFGVRGMLSCVDATSGKKIWRTDDFPGSWPVFFTSSSPLVAGQMGIFQSGGQRGGGIVAHDLATGEIRWKWTGDKPAYSSPVLLKLGSEQFVVALTENNVVALNVKDGKAWWQKEFPAARRAYNAATPILDGAKVIYTGANRGTFAVELSLAGDHLEAKALWENREADVQFNTPVLKDGHLYAISPRGTLYCLAASTGKMTWSQALGGRGGFGSIVDVGSALFALTPESELIVFAPDPKAYRELARYKVADTQCYAHPVPAGNRIYVKAQDTLTCWALE